MNHMQRLDCVRLIASELQSIMKTSEINVFLSGFGITCGKTEIVPSKRVYVEGLLADSTPDTIRQIVEQLDIQPPVLASKMNNKINGFLNEFDSFQDDYEVTRWVLKVTKFLEHSGHQDKAKVFSGLSISGNIWDDAAAQKGYLEAILYESNGKDEVIKPIIPHDIDTLVRIITKNTEKSIVPLKSRRKGCSTIEFENEYDYQDYLHSSLIPWIKDIRPEEYTPKYAGTNKRVDFYLKEHQTFIEVKYVRDKSHAKRIGDELTIDISHYQSHSGCRILYTVIFDPLRLVKNPDGLVADLSMKYRADTNEIEVRVIIVS